MKNFIIIIFCLFISCVDDSVDMPSCYITAYREVGILREDSIEKIGYSSELRYDLSNRVVSRRNYDLNYGFRVLTIDSVIYEGNRATEIRKLDPSGELKKSYQLRYKNGLIHTIDYYSVRYRSDQVDTVLTKSEKIEYDVKKRISTVSTVDTVNYPLYGSYDTTRYSYEGNNLAEISQITYFVSSGDTSEVCQVTKEFSDFDSKRNPLKGIVFPDLRYAAYSENNYREYEEVIQKNGNVTSTHYWESTLEYNEQGYPDIGEYSCSQ